MLASLIGAFISGEAAEAARRAKAAAITYVLAALLLLCGAGFLVGAAYVAAARRFGTISAALGFGIGFVVLGAIVLAVHAIAAAMRKRRRNKFGAEFATVAAAAALAGLPLLMKRSGLAGALAPLIALVGYAIYRENSPGPTPSEDDPPPG